MTAPPSEPQDENVVPLEAGYEPAPEPVPAPPGRLHGTFIGGMAVSALIGVAALFAFITIGWPESIRRYIIGVFFFAGIVFLACASAAVFSAARDTYPERGSKPLD